MEEFVLDISPLKSNLNKVVLSCFLQYFNLHNIWPFASKTISLSLPLLLYMQKTVQKNALKYAPSIMMQIMLNNSAHYLKTFKSFAPEYIFLWLSFIAKMCWRLSLEKRQRFISSPIRVMYSTTKGVQSLKSTHMFWSVQKVWTVQIKKLIWSI